MENYIPKHLDAPRRLIIFTIDEAIAIALPFVIFVFFLGQQIVAIFVCGVVYFSLKKLKGDRPPSYIWHLVYWHFPPIFAFRVLPSSYKKRFIG